MHCMSYILLTRQKTSPALLWNVKMFPRTVDATCASGGPAIVPYFAPPYQYKFEQIWTNNVRSKVNTEKECEHYKRELLPDGGTLYHWVSQRTNNLGWWEGFAPTIAMPPNIDGYMSHPFGSYDMYDASKGNGFCNHPYNADVGNHRAVNSMLPRIQANLSLVNSVIELKDFKSLGHTITGLADWSRKWLTRNRLKSAAKTVGSKFERLRRTFDPSFGPTLGETMRTGADVHLQSQFNILPLISDICGLDAALIATRGKVNSLLQNEGRLRRAVYTDLFEVPDLFIPNQNLTYHVGGFEGYSNGLCSVYGGSALGYMVTRRTEVAKGKFHARLIFTYHFSAYEREHAQILGLLDSLGVNLNPQIVWNAIPFSFIVDWVAGVGKWLDNRKRFNLSPIVNVHNYCYSLKTSRMVKTDFVSYTTPPPSFSGQSKLSLPRVFETAYTRRLGFPQGIDSVLTSGLSRGEIALGLSLGISLRKPKRRVH